MDILWEKPDTTTIDLMVFGAHPDDAELGAGGLLAKEAKRGYKVAIVDLTKGEMGTNGTPEERREESQKAAEILGLSLRVNMEMPDCNVEVTQENVLAVVEVMRRWKPKIVIAPYWEDRHPDHEACSKIVSQAHFKCGLPKIITQSKPYRPKTVLYYPQHEQVKCSFVVDISDDYETKINSVWAHESQFSHVRQATELNQWHFLYHMKSKFQFYGSQIGAHYGEGFIYKRTLHIDDPLEYWR